MSSLLNILKGAYNVGRPIARKAGLDTLTNPQTYIGLADDVTNTLGRMIPKGLQGVNIQNAPMRLLGEVSDIANMAPGAAREAARNQTARNFRMADRLGDAVRPAGQGASGALRAPNVGNATPRPIVPTSAPATQLPQVGGPLARDYALGRSSGAVNEMAQIRKALQQVPTKAKGLFSGLSKGNIAANLIGGGVDITTRLNAGENPVDAVGRTIFGTAGGIAGGFGAGLLGLPTGPGAVAASLAGSGTGYVAGSNAYDFLKQEMFPTVPQDIIDIRNRRLAKEGKKPSNSETKSDIPSQTPSKSIVDSIPPELLPPQYNLPEGAGIPINPREMEKYRVRPEGTYGSIPPSVNDDLPGQNYDSSVTLPGAPTINNPPYIPPTTLTPDPVPPAPTPDIGQAMDPYAYQLNVYGQGRQDAATQSSQAAVRDLGLSIHRQLHPNLYKNDGPKTPLQEPSTMNNLDAMSELEASTNAVEELIDPTILAQLNAMNLRRSGY